MEYLLNTLPEELKKILNECVEDDKLKDLAKRGQKLRPDLSDDWIKHIIWANRQLGVEAQKITALLDPYSIINRDTTYLSPKLLKKLAELDPDNLVKKSLGIVFNRYIFRPKKGDNLTVWLFGDKKSGTHGKVEERLRANYRRIENKYKKTDKNIVKNIKYEHELYRDDEGEDNEEPSPYENYGLRDQSAIESITLREYKEDIMSKGMSERDATIYIDKIVNETPSPEIGNRYNLSKRHINRIIKKAQDKLDISRKK